MSDQQKPGKRALSCDSTLHTQHLTPSKGFTLLEVLVALAVLSLALVVLLGLRNRDVGLVTETRYLTAATALARMKMVETGMEGFPEIGEMAGEFGEGYPEFRWHRVISSTPFDYVREVRISVMWGKNDREGVELVNYVFEER
jgi:general secretion pathway protein I